MSDAPRTAPEEPRQIDSPLGQQNTFEQLDSPQYTEEEETGLNLYDSVLDENQSNFAPDSQSNSIEAEGLTLDSDSGVAKSEIDYGKLAVGAISDTIEQASSKDGALDKLSKRIDARVTGDNQDNRYLAMANGSSKGKLFAERGNVEQLNGSSYVVGHDGHISNFTHASIDGKEPLELTNIKHDENGYLKSYTDHDGYQFQRLGNVDQNGYGTWQASINGQAREYGGTGTSQFRAKMLLDENGLSKLIGKPLEGQQSHLAAGKMYWRNSDSTIIHSSPESNSNNELTGLSSSIELRSGDKFTRSSSFDNGKATSLVSDLKKVNAPKLKMDKSNAQEIEIDDAFQITYGEESKPKEKMEQTKTSGHSSENPDGELEITDVKQLFDKLAGPSMLKKAAEVVSDVVVPFAAPVYDALTELGAEGGYLDSISSKAEANKLASGHTRRYNEHLNGPRNDVHEERGLVEKPNGLSYKIDDNGKMTEITFPKAEGEEKPAKYSNIKYDQEGKLKEYQVASGHKFTRQGSEDENGFAKWNCTWTSQDGRVYDTKYSGAGDSTYNANVKIDKNGASIMMGEPLSEANKEFTGNLYYRSANADRTNSAPIRNEDGKTIGIKTKMKVDGEGTSLESKFDQTGNLKPDFAPMATEAIARLYEGVNSLTQTDGMLDNARKSVEARNLADTQDARYAQMQKGPQAKLLESSGKVEQADGSSFVVGENKQISSFTYAKVGSNEPYGLSDIKYDDQGYLKSYTTSKGYSFNRTTGVDSGGFGTWQASKDGRELDYGGTGTKQFQANMMLDEKGLTKLIGKPLPGQSHDSEGKMYWRNSDSSIVHSTPQREEGGNFSGLNSEVTLSNGKEFTRTSSLNENNQLESNLDLRKQEKLTEEQVERKAKVEEIKDKIESLEDPIMELTNAFKKFEQIGGLQISQDRDGSYKANLQYKGPNWLPSQFNGPVTYKKGRPVWSTGMSLNPNISFNFRPTDDGVMVDRMSGVFSSANWKGIRASGPQNWMQLGKGDNGTPYMKANTTSTGSKRVLFWNFSRTETNTNTFTASDFKHNTGMRSMLSDSSAIDGLNGALKLFENADVTNLSMNRPNPKKPGDFDVNVKFREDKELKLDEKMEGPLELDSIKLAKDLKFQIRQGADGADQDRNPDSVEIDASGITANIQIGSNENRLLQVQPKKVTIAKDSSGNAVLQMHIESDQIKKLQSANFEVDLNDLDKVKSGKVTLVNVPLLKAFSGAAIQELTNAAERKDR